MRDFAYHHPTSLDDAQRLATEPGAALLAGGQTLLREMKRGRLSPTSLVDVAGLVPRDIAIDDGAVFVGAGATHADVAASSVVQRRLPALAALVGHIGDPAVRNRGTLGGAVAANEPAGDYPAACLALDATIHTTARRIAAADFFLGAGDGRTVLEAGEIVTAATFPVPSHAGYVKFLNPAARYAMVGVFAARTADGGARVSVTGARARGAFRWHDAETALDAAFAPESLRDVRLPAEGLVEDLFADAAYRAHLTEVLARRALALATGPSPGALVLSHGSCR